MKTYDGVIKEIAPTGVRFVKNVRFDNGNVSQTEIFLPLSGRAVSSAPKPVAAPEGGQPGPAKAVKDGPAKEAAGKPRSENE
jgi:hypothetical protein